MSIVHTPISWDYTRSRNQNLADAINKHWGVHVAKPGYDSYMQSTLRNGVPRIAVDQQYKHEDIIWVYIDLDGKWQVRK